MTGDFCLRSDKRPNLIGLHPLAGKIPHRAVHELRAGRAKLYQKFCDGCSLQHVQPHNFQDGGYAVTSGMDGIDTDTKRIACWMLGARDANTARDFIDDLADRMADAFN